MLSAVGDGTVGWFDPEPAAPASQGTTGAGVAATYKDPAPEWAADASDIEDSSDDSESLDGSLSGSGEESEPSSTQKTARRRRRRFGLGVSMRRVLNSGAMRAIKRAVAKLPKVYGGGTDARFGEAQRGRMEEEEGWRSSFKWEQYWLRRRLLQRARMCWCYGLSGAVPSADA